MVIASSIDEHIADIFSATLLSNSLFEMDSDIEVGAFCYVNSVPKGDC